MTVLKARNLAVLAVLLAMLLFGFSIPSSAAIRSYDSRLFAIYDGTIYVLEPFALPVNALNVDVAATIEVDLIVCPDTQSPAPINPYTVIAATAGAHGFSDGANNQAITRQRALMNDRRARAAILWLNFDRHGNAGRDNSSRPFRIRNNC